MSETKDIQDEPKGPTPEEIKERKKELTKFYNEELPLLKKQAEYEELLTKIDVAKMTRFEIMVTRAQIMQGGPQEPPMPEGMHDSLSEEPKAEKKSKKGQKRSLKTTE